MITFVKVGNWIGKLFKTSILSIVKKSLLGPQELIMILNYSAVQMDFISEPKS